jgi:hypothetical protein
MRATYIIGSIALDTPGKPRRSIVLRDDGSIWCAGININPRPKYCHDRATAIRAVAEMYGEFFQTTRPIWRLRLSRSATTIARKIGLPYTPRGAYYSAAHSPVGTWRLRMAICDASDDPGYWRGEVAVHSPIGTWAERMAACDACHNPAYRRGDVATHAPIGTWAERMAACDACDNPAYRRGDAAARSPIGTWAERMAACDASNDPGYWRGEVAVYSPVGTRRQRIAACNASHNSAYWRRRLTRRRAGATTP